jgi:hypothetical protein
MAETYSVQYAAAFVSAPRGNNYAYGRAQRPFDFDYVQAATGTAGDTILLAKLPPKSTVDMYRSWFAWSGWTSGATLSIGWQAYTDEDGMLQSASAAGLLSAVSMTADGAWAHAMLVIATPDDSIPVVGRKIFNNRTSVTLFATIGTQAPGAADILSGSFAVQTA